MTFLNPLAFSFLTIVPVIVLLYLLKLKRRPVHVSTLMFWQRVLRENRRRALFQKLRQLLSLLLHLLIFLLILLALAKPEFDRFVKAGASTVLILDTRARMQARESAGESRFEKAKRLVAVRASRAGPQNQMALLAADSDANVVVPFTGDGKALQEAIAKLEPTDAAGDLKASLQFADELLASRSGPKQIVVFTDTESKIQLQRTRSDGQAFHPESKIEFVSTGTGSDNVAITRFATRPVPASRQTSEVLLEISNFSDKPARGNVELYFDGKAIDVKPYAIEPNGRRLDIFPSVPRAGANARGWLTARLDSKDALAVDNAACAVLPAHEPARILLVTRDNWFIEKMLEADDLIKFDLLAPDAFRLDMAKNFDAVILDGELPEGFDLEKAAGNCLFIKKTPFATDPSLLDQPLVSDTDETSPILRLVNLQNVTFLRSEKIRFREAVGSWRFQAPLRSFDHPLVITGSRRFENAREQRLAAFGFDVADSDLPLRVAFPLLMSNTLQWLAGETAEAAMSAHAGEAIDLSRGQTVWTEPQRAITTIGKIDSAHLARSSFRPVKNGFYLVQDEDKLSWLAVNTFSATESDLRTSDTAAKSAQPLRIPQSAFRDLVAWHFWTWLALAAFALCYLEWWLYHRRRTE